MYIRGADRINLQLPMTSVVEKTGVPGESHRPVASHRQNLSHNVVSSAPRLRGVRTHSISDDRH